MQIQDIMAREVISCSPDDSIREAARLMRDRNVGCVVVANAGKVEGMLTDRDITVRCTAEGHDVQSPVSSCMTTSVATVNPEMDVLDLAHQMAERQVRRIPVTKDGQLIGLVSFSDIGWALDRPVHDILHAGAAGARHPVGV